MPCPVRFGDLIDGLGSTMFSEFDQTAFMNMSAADQAANMQAKRASRVARFGSENVQSAKF